MRYSVFPSLLACLVAALLLPPPAHASTDGTAGAQPWSVVVTDQNGGRLEVVQVAAGEATTFTISFANSSGPAGRVTLLVTPDSDGTTTTIELDTASEDHVFRVPNADACSGPPVPDPALEEAIDSWVTGADYAELPRSPGRPPRCCGDPTRTLP